MPLIEKNRRQRTMSRVMDMCLGMASGRWYDNGIGIALDQTATDARAENTLYATPILLDHDVSLDRIAVEPTQTSPSGLIYMGIYSNDRGLPGSLLLDAGTIAFTTSGAKEITISLDCKAGWYWLVWMHTHTGNRSFRSYNYIEGQAALGFASSTDTSKSLFLSAAVGTPGMPATFPVATYVQDKPPRILVRVA